MAENVDMTRLAELLISHVRDESIKEIDRLLLGNSRAVGGERWNAVAADPRAREGVRELTPEIVDEVIFRLLHAAENGDISLAWRRGDGTYVTLEELGGGEMTGWYTMGEGGWVDRFSSQRFFDQAKGRTVER